jgi:23S rRNA (adenine2030-N6)-methyltransferase
MDPSWEIKDEYKTIPKAIKQACSRFATGTYCLWYPIIDKRLHNQLVTGMKGIDVNNALQIEFYMTTKPQQGMTGCGLWVINPPYLLANEMKSILDYLRTIFNKGVSSYLIQQTGSDKKSL